MRFKHVLGFLKARFRELGILDDEAFDAFHELLETIEYSNCKHLDSGLVLDEDFDKEIE